MPNFQNLLDYFGKNIDHAGQLQKDTSRQMMDRIKMSNNPEMQGPPLPDVTPEEKEYYDSLSTGMMGSVAPVAKAAPTMMQMAKETFSKGREADFATRLAEQAKAAKFQSIKKYLGR